MPRITGRPMVKNAVRRKMWTAMRIMRVFDIPSIIKTSSTPENPVTYENAKKYVQFLVRHGFVRKRGSRYAKGQSAVQPGQYQAFVLVKDTGPEPPTVCPRCGNPLHKKCEVKHG